MSLYYNFFQFQNLCDSLSLSAVDDAVNDNGNGNGHKFKNPKFQTEQEDSGEDSPIVARGSKKPKAKKNFLDDSDDDNEASKEVNTKLRRIGGPNLRFVLEASIKALISKSSQSSIMITLNRVHSIHDSQPDLNLSDYLNFQTCFHEYLLCKYLFWSKCEFIP